MHARTAHRTPLNNRLRLTRTLAGWLTAGLAGWWIPAQAQVNYVDFQLSPGTPSLRVNNSSDWQTVTGATQLLRGRPATLVGTGTAALTGRSELGTAKASASAEGGGFRSFAFAGWQDTITFNTGSNGTRGLVTFDLGFDWTLSAQATAGGDAIANAFVDINLNSSEPAGALGRYQYASVGQTASSTCSASGACDTSTGNLETFVQILGESLPGVTRPTAKGQVASLYFSVVFGQPYRIDVAINAFVEGSLSQATADATHSLTWAGVSAVQDSTEAALPFSIVSASGFDYSQPYAAAVPEPGSALLLCLGVLGLGLVTRRADS